jgi:hypothetical protein
MTQRMPLRGGIDVRQQGPAFKTLMMAHRCLKFDSG